MVNGIHLCVGFGFNQRILISHRVIKLRLHCFDALCINFVTCLFGRVLCDFLLQNMCRDSIKSGNSGLEHSLHRHEQNEQSMRELHREQSMSKKRTGSLKNDD